MKLKPRTSSEKGTSQGLLMLVNEGVLPGSWVPRAPFAMPRTALGTLGVPQDQGSVIPPQLVCQGLPAVT